MKLKYKKDEDSQLDLNIQINFDNNGSEKNTNSFPNYNLQTMLLLVFVWNE